MNQSPLINQTPVIPSSIPAINPILTINSPSMVNPTVSIVPNTAINRTSEVSPSPLSLQQQNQISSSLQPRNSSVDLPPINLTASPIVNLTTIVSPLEERFTSDFVEYLNLPFPTRLPTLQEAQNILSQIEKETGIKPALIYIGFMPKGSHNSQKSQRSSLLQVQPEIQGSDELEMMVVTAEGSPIYKSISHTTRDQVVAVAQEFNNEVTNPRKRDSRSYLPTAQKLYQWIMAPLEADLQARGIQNLVFISDLGLRSLPMAALHDGKGFLIERYSVGMMPSLSLTDTSFANIRNAQVLAMGASQFTDQGPLPAVPVELSTITPQLWQGKLLLNEAFTLPNLKAERQQVPFGIVHLATHADFKSGAPSNSYIQLWDSKLRLDQLRQLGWNHPQVELLVLSACKTAVGDRDAELGFGGLAVQAGVKSALATLWSVSDEGTLGFMAEFYHQLKLAPIKAEAMRQAQLAMLHGEVRIEDGKLHTDFEDVQLPPALARTNDLSLTHPYYWAAFRMIGSPW